MKKNFISVETTYPNLKSAKKIAKILLEKKLAACVQFCEIESAYFWEKNLENSKEILVKIKSKKSLYSQIESLIKKHHDYEIPQIISTQIDQGFAPYLNWISNSTTNRK